MINTVFDKTDKGREEIATRKYQLAPRLRTLLVMIDGKHTGDDLLKKVSSLGLSETSLAELADQGFIQAAVPEQAPEVVSAPLEPLVATAAASEAPLPEGQNQFQAIYHFYTQTIKSMIGLRGYALQLKVEKAGSIEEFRALRLPYLEAVLKAKGDEAARSLRQRLDQLLYLGESAPADTIPAQPAAE
ncbi:hypothetical protein [Noviherbaspirillum autotrophicum]|uniref:Proline-rich protein n=1 Tax=Noviherbaspirillum autotrophicum TaxID=709839 RepID=A0A0C2BMS2_9BURK|nr:hypothetical protein [Noviherbaspirillum autotrophicum]KIF82555.1 hypothetical protein TSA66_19830 [Noviherbaspirillum autotrophicum]